MLRTTQVAEFNFVNRQRISIRQTCHLEILEIRWKVAGKDKGHMLPFATASDPGHMVADQPIE